MPESSRARPKAINEKVQVVDDPDKEFDMDMTTVRLTQEVKAAG